MRIAIALIASLAFLSLTAVSIPRPSPAGVPQTHLSGYRHLHPPLRN